ncbi:bifunctional 4-hydroxy-2-oxoglutarate aldolase/2-dehydro-3-deoxy-phosphogluconate aldolase [Clostridium sp.]
MDKTINKIKENKIIAIVRGIDQDKILKTAEALYSGGISLVEVTFNQSSPNGNKETLDAIKSISVNLGDKICVGAGTVMTVEQVELAVKAGAKYIISPNFDKEVVAKTLELGAVSMPGVITPSEIADAYKAGANFIKIFPAGNFGADYIKSIKAPINHIPMLAVGGIDLNNLKEYMDTGIVGVGLGSSLVNKKLINEGSFDELTELAKKFVLQL